MPERGQVCGFRLSATAHLTITTGWRNLNSKHCLQKDTKLITNCEIKRDLSGLGLVMNYIPDNSAYYSVSRYSNLWCDKF